MILTCPACSSRYLIDPAALGRGGRTVRCASCGNRWFARPPEDAPRSALVAEPADTAEERPGARERQTPPPARRPAVAAGAVADGDEPGGRSGRLIGWLALALVVLVAAGALVGRNEVVAAFPGAASIYRKLGLPVTVPLGLEFRDVTSARLSEGGVSVLVVEGEIVNVTGEDRTVPRVRVTLLDDARRELEHELFAAERPALDGGGATRFTARLVNPPVPACSFSVTFATDS